MKNDQNYRTRLHLAVSEAGYSRKGRMARSST